MSLWNQIMGHSSINAAGGMLANGYNPYQNQMSSGLANMNAAQQQSLLAQQYNAQFKPKRWMIDGKAMEFEEFVNTIYPEDCAEKTYLILKFKKDE